MALILRPTFPNLWPVSSRPEAGPPGANDLGLKTDWWSAEGDTSRMDVTVREGEQRE